MAPAKTVATSSDSPRGKPSTKWDENAHKALCCAFMDAMDAGSFSIRANADILVQSMTDRGHPFSWEGIR